MQFTGDDELAFPGVAGDILQPWDQYTLVFWLRVPAMATNAIIFHTTKGTDTGFFGTELSLDEGRLFFAVKRFWPGNAIAVRSLDAIPRDEWVQIAASRLRWFRARGMGMMLFLKGRPQR